MKIQARVLLIGSVILVFVGFMLWMVVGPTVILRGIPPRDHERSFFKAYSWLSGSEPSLAEISSTYWLGFGIGIIGLCILAAGIIGVILTLVLKYSPTYQKKESGLGSAA